MKQYAGLPYGEILTKRVATRLMLLYIVFIAMTITGIISVVSGLVLWLGDGGNGYRGGDGARRGYRANEIMETYQSIEKRNIILGLERSTWKDIHVYSSLACVILVLVHAVLNWRWIVCSTRAIFGSS